MNKNKFGSVPSVNIFRTLNLVRTFAPRKSVKENRYNPCNKCGKMTRYSICHSCFQEEQNAANKTE